MNRTDSIVEKYFNEGLLTSTGGRDKYGNHLITLPVNQLISLETAHARYLVGVLQKYIAWQNLLFTNQPGIVLIFNLKNCRKIVLQLLAEAMDIIESKKQVMVQTVYIVKPESRVKSHYLKKLLGIKSSHSTASPTRNFQIQLVKNVEVLKEYIESSQLTKDFGGTMYHDHLTWLGYYQKVYPCLSSANDLITQLQGIKDRIDLWEEYDTQESSTEQIQNTLSNITEQYENILKETRFEIIIEDCKQMIHILEAPAGHFQMDVDVSLTAPASSILKKHYQDLTKFRQEIQGLYKSAETRFSTTHQLQKCKDRADQIVSSITDKYIDQLNDHPAVATTVGQAEIYRNRFTSSLYTPCKDLISLATDILEEMKKYDESELRTIITNHLTTTIHPFTLQLQNIHETYIAIHIFHTLLNKFAKWYKKVITFLPEYLRSQINLTSPDKLIYMPDEWSFTVDAFVAKHPPPREDHIAKLDQEIPALLPRHLKQQAHCLAIRTKLLQRLLTSRRLPVKLITAAMKWKDELKPPTGPGKVKPHIQIFAPSSDESEVAGERIRIKPPRSPRRKSIPKVEVENTIDKADRTRQFPPLDPLAALPKQQDIKSESELSQGHSFKRTNLTVQTSSNPGDDTSTPKAEAQKERFIRLTFTPKDVLDGPSGARRRFSFSDIAKDANESESGIEVVDTEDPYDTIVEKIREVSNSPMSSDLKLKYVTSLLRCSLKDVEQRQKPKYTKNPKRAKRHSKLKSAYGRSVGNLLDFEEPKLASFHSLRNLNVASDTESDLSVSPERPDYFLTSLRPSNSLHNLYTEMQRLPCTPDKTRWYDDFSRTREEPILAEPSNSRFQQDLDRLRQCQSERLAEESMLQKEKQRLDEIVMEAELFKQDSVEMSLRRSHDILRKEEMRHVESSGASDFSDWREHIPPTQYDDFLPHSPINRYDIIAKSDLGYDSVSSPASYSRTTGSHRPTLSNKTSYEESDLQHGANYNWTVPTSHDRVPKYDTSPQDRVLRYDPSPQDRLPMFDASPQDRVPRYDASPQDRVPRYDASPQDRVPMFDASPQDRLPRYDASPQDRVPKYELSPQYKVSMYDVSQAPSVSSLTPQYSNAGQALSSVLPKFKSTEEIDEFCVQLRSRNLHNKTESLDHCEVPVTTTNNFGHNESNSSFVTRQT